MDEIKNKNWNIEYKYYKLKNQIEVLSLKDNDAKNSACSLTINTGSYDDDNNIEGVAHFLEHMILMGSDKYPQENNFMRYVNEKGGLVNAMTGNYFTSYFYEISSKYINDSLDIFIHLFIRPLLSKRSMNREIMAVNSEHKKNVNNDEWRKTKLLKNITKKNHEYSKFTTGNNKTLKKENIHEIMKKFYKNNYSSNLMKLVIYDNKFIDNKILKLLNKIENKNKKKNTVMKCHFMIHKI